MVTHRAFTLLEILLVIAIIAALSGLIIFTTSPANILNRVGDLQNSENNNSLINAIKSYQLDNNGFLPTSVQQITESGQYNICKYQQAGSCINLDELVINGYLSSIPINPRENTELLTGYTINYNVNTLDFSISSGNIQEAISQYCPIGEECLGPIAEWELNENSGIETINSGTTIISPLVLTNGPIWTSGVSGSAVDFDGTNDFLLGSNTLNFERTDSFSISTWVRKDRNGSNEAIISKMESSGNYRGWLLWFTGDKPSFILRNTVTTNYLQMTTANTFPSSSSYRHITVTYSGQSNPESVKLFVNGIPQNLFTISNNLNATIQSSINLNIGARNNNSIFLDGATDRIRVYNYVRSPREIGWEYNQGLPIVKLSFDENTGSLTSSSSENSLSGSIFQAQWVSGKNNSGLYFDGIDDNIDFGDPANSLLDFGTNLDFSITGWIKTNSGLKQAIISKGLNTSGAGTGWAIYKDSDGQLSMDINVSTLNTFVFPSNLNDDNWHHFAITLDRDSTITGYIDGIQEASYDISSITGSMNNVSNLYIGRFLTSTSNMLNGTIDEVKFYGYALSPNQVLEDAN